MILRREIDEAKIEALGIENNENPHHVIRKSSLLKKSKHIILDDEGKSYFKGFKWISFAAFVIYVAAIFSVTIAVRIGSFPFTLLAFGVLLGIGNFISFASVLMRFNFHFLLLVVAFIFGNFTDPHLATVVKRKINWLSLANGKT